MAESQEKHTRAALNYVVSLQPKKNDPITGNSSPLGPRQSQHNGPISITCHDVVISGKIMDFS